MYMHSEHTFTCIYKMHVRTLYIYIYTHAYAGYSTCEKVCPIFIHIRTRNICPVWAIYVP